MSVLIRRIWGVLPVPVLYTDRLPERVGGEARGPLVRIRPLYRDRGDEGLHQHELEHVRQFWRAWIIVAAVLMPAAYFAGAMAMIVAWAFGAHWDAQAAVYAAATAALAHPFAYRLIRRYRLYAEASAYAEQMRHPDGLGGALTLEAAALRLTAPRYKLGLTLDQARAALLSES